MLFFILILTSRLFSQEYKKLVDSTNKWNYLDKAFTTCGCGEARTYSLFLSNDTIIENISYKKVISKIIKYNSIDTVYAAAIREDTIKQTVYIKQQDNPEKLLYSFDHKVKDTISIDTTYYKDYVTIKYVKSIDDYVFNGIGGKRIGICDTTKRLNSSSPPYESFTDFWYEGIGSFKQLFDLSHIGGFSIDMELLCFWNNSNFIYQNPNWTVCEYAIYAGIDENYNSSDFLLYPNPTTGLITVESNKLIKEIYVIDIYDKTILNSKEVKLDISNQPNGFYILRIRTVNNQLIDRKVMKNAL